MRAAAGKGFINATDLADYLTKKGMPFRDAYEVTGRLAAMYIEQQKTLEHLTLDELKKASSLFEMSTKQSIWRIVCIDAR